MSSLTNNLYRFGDFSLDAQSCVLMRGDEAVPLTRKAFDVLLLLIQNSGRIVTKVELMKAVWPDSFVEESNLTQTIFMVRKALDETADKRYIINVQGQGYRFVVPVAETDKHGAEIQAPVAVADERDRRSVPEVQLESRGQVAAFSRTPPFVE